MIVKNVLNGPAPKDLADLSRVSSTDDIETIVALAIKGSETTAAANVAATQVNTTSVPNKTVDRRPIGPSLPTNNKSVYPSTTGGNANGSETINSSKNFPRNSFLPTAHPINKAMGIFNAVASTDILTVKNIISIIITIHWENGVNIMFRNNEPVFF